MTLKTNLQQSFEKQNKTKALYNATANAVLGFGLSVLLSIFLSTKLLCVLSISGKELLLASLGNTFVYFIVSFLRSYLISLTENLFLKNPNSRSKK